MKSIKFYILVLLLCLAAGKRSFSQTVDAPDLHCVSVDNNGDIKLDWSLPLNTCGVFNAYLIFWSNNINGPYAPIAITNQAQLSFTHVVGNGATITYYYYMVSDFNCPGATFLHSDTIDNLDPVTPKINYVTVNGNFAELNWEPSTSPEAYGYIVYRVLGGFNYIDTVYGKDNTSYIDFNSTPSTDSMSYSLATIDSCMNTGPINDFPQHTIFLDDTVLRCTQQVILNWTFYDNWSNGVQQYDIFLAQNGSPSALLKTVPATKRIDTLTGFADGDILCFTVMARENVTGFASTSNEACVQVNVVQPANDFYLRNINVIAPNKIAVSYSVDALADLVSIQIDRAIDPGNFSKLSQFAPPADLSVINTYIDSTVSPSENSYYYRFIATDSCGNRDTSTTGKSILLEGYAFSDLTFFLKWDESHFDSVKVLSYDVYRDDGAGFNLITSLSPDAFSYEEAGLSTTTPCYYIEAIDSMLFANGTKDTIHSRSNILCLNQPSQIYMPNAFAPLGKNNIFKPVLNVAEIESYSFFVFDRWGEQLFATTDPSEGWDGIFNGRIVQQGAYAYLVKVLDGNGRNVEAKGTVLVVR